MNEIASRYGQALFSLASELNKVDRYQEECKELRRILKENADFIMVLSSPFLSIEDRIEMVDKTLKDLDDNILSLIKIMIENNRINLLEEVLLSFNSICNDYRGVMEGLAYSTIPLDETTLNRIEKKIEEKEGKKIELINRIDPTLIGGIKIVVNNHIYDGTIKNQLENLKINLLKKEGEL